MHAGWFDAVESNALPPRSPLNLTVNALYEEGLRGIEDSVGKRFNHKLTITNLYNQSIGLTTIVLRKGNCLVVDNKVFDNLVKNKTIASYSVDY